MGVRGFVRNLPSGEVEVHAEAESALLNDFKKELERGPHAARVSEVVEQDLPVSNLYGGFFIG